MFKKSISLLLCAVFAFYLCLFTLPETALAYTSTSAPSSIDPNAMPSIDPSIAPSDNSYYGGGSGPVPTTVYNDPSVSGISIKLSGVGLSGADQLVAKPDPQGSTYNALLRLANSDDVLSTYNISLRSGTKSTGGAMDITFDLDSKYAGQAFTLVHQKANGSYEYFTATADTYGDVTFGPLYELSPFMLVRGTLEQTAYVNLTDAPKTGDNAEAALWSGAVLLIAFAMLIAIAPRKRRN